MLDRSTNKSLVIGIAMMTRYTRMIWNIVSQPYAPELRIVGICIIDVAIAKKRSTIFVRLRKKLRQSGNEIAKRMMISTSKIIVATISVIAKLALGGKNSVLKRFADVGDMVAVLKA